MFNRNKKDGAEMNNEGKGETAMNPEIKELLQKAEETKQLIEDAQNLLDAVLEDLEDLYAEECDDVINNVSDEDFPV